MEARQEWFTAQQLSGMPGMPTTDRRVRSLLEKNLTVNRPKGSGKGLEYSRASLPEKTQAWLDQRDLQEVLKHLPPEVAQSAAEPGVTAVARAARNTLAVTHPEDHPTTAAQRDRELARQITLRALQAIQRAQACSARRAAQRLLISARAGELAAPVLARMRQACDERGRYAAAGDDGLPSVVSLTRWARAHAAGRRLAPRSGAVVDISVRPWYAPFFALTDRPQKPTLKWAWQTLLENWRPEWSDSAAGAPPSLHACVRAYAKRSALDKLEGRHSGSALRARTFFHKRTYKGLAPFDEVHADGWTSHFTAPHPVTGAFVTYELWHFHDVATRYLTPMAVGLTENTDTILEGLQACLRVGGQIAVWQTDHSSSVKNAQVLQEHSGLAERLGITVVHPQEVGNSQANGIAENFNTWLDREARALATYQHPQRMDSATFVRVRRITNAMVRAADKPEERAALRARAIKLGKGVVFDSWAEAQDWIRGLERKWNHHPHRELPKIADAASGRQRHMTPQESLDAALAAGWQPLRLSDEVLADQFRRHLRKSVYRGCVTPFGGQRYHAPELAHLEGQEVLVAIERDDPGAVDVKDLEGRLIVRAELVQAVSPRSESMREHTERKRADARIRLRVNQIAQIEAEQAPMVIEAPLHLPDPALLGPLPERAPLLRAGELDAEELAALLRRGGEGGGGAGGTDGADGASAVMYALPRRERARDYLDQMGEVLERLNAAEAAAQERAAAGGQ